MKKHAPATARNNRPIANVLEKELPFIGTVLEIASGTGEHAVYLANRFPSLDWQPSDADPEALLSIKAWRDEAGLTNIRPPVTIDCTSASWPIDQADAVLCVNMVHISPWTATEGLFAGARKVLSAGNAPLILYGPFREADIPTAASNEAFDRSLKERDERWGLRHVGDIDKVAGRRGFYRAKRYEMPANNLILVYRKTIGE
ncbi:DUF938 domain-containing protein [Altererythrobacter aurantiacus]|uniref:DUF938 domain-containing protein n=1 Tax=Parapontixanthobacter aurantiacus TaxID=1463599 RepID=A0A844ZGG3_9SPHN|nr:DUF938 domain-containing protein [Parapontixanthobacter aurantiacus]MXO84809.1 DUF938 domain-containing protein [Parapontixanthobacter aurantiacus]